VNRHNTIQKGTLIVSLVDDTDADETTDDTVVKVGAIPVVVVVVVVVVLVLVVLWSPLMLLLLLWIPTGGRMGDVDAVTVSSFGIAENDSIISFMRSLDDDDDDDDGVPIIVGTCTPVRIRRGNVCGIITVWKPCTTPTDTTHNQSCQYRVE
jgi:hypothetical protein